MDGWPMAFAALFLIASMVAMGLESERGTLALELQRRGMLLRALVANLVLVPLGAVAIAAVADPATWMRPAFLILAVTPGGLFALHFVRVSRGNTPLAVALQFVLSALALLLILPGIVMLHPRVQLAQVPVWRMGALLGAFGVLPLVVGRLLARRKTAWSSRLGRVLPLLAMVGFVGFSLSARAMRRQALDQLGAGEIGVLVALVLLGWLAGSLAAADTSARDQATLAITTSMRNVAAILLPASTIAGTEALQATVVAYSAVAVPMNLVLMLLLRSVGLEPRPVSRAQPRADARGFARAGTRHSPAQKG